eukprot:CAMPEP_0202713258 /NCGR_PEP_ID=MMETSP1385-20130828/52459_1 /ASSEMBLY_ACC=CAM_ASM_000861 /TAXON_ID=933848 /ORGANISM="Elphidium margaritaceum" /LENGTH=87 /DNA_ID=CAMNT_0049373551 /DNA_START=444 /DNA_END=707 /DNA_ORIENTATION=-
MYRNTRTDDLQLQFVSILLRRYTIHTNLKHLKALDKSAHIGLSNVQLSDVNKSCFFNEQDLPIDISKAIGFNQESKEELDKSWMGKQ